MMLAEVGSRGIYLYFLQPSQVGFPMYGLGFSDG